MKSLQKPDDEIYRPDRKALLKIMGLGVGLCVLLGISFYMSLVGILFTIPVFILFTGFMINRYTEKKKHRMEIQFKDAMVTMTSALQTGYALSKAFEEALNVSTAVYGKDSMIVDLLTRYVSGQKLNIPIEQLLREMERNGNLPIISELADVIRITRQYGGNLPELITKQTKITEDNLILKSEILSTTASLRYEAYVMDIIPVAIIWYLNLTGAGALSQIYHTVFGYVFMSICLYVYLAAVLWQFKIMEKFIV